MGKQASFTGRIGRTFADSESAWPPLDRATANAPRAVTASAAVGAMASGVMAGAAVDVTEAATGAAIVVATAATNVTINLPLGPANNRVDLCWRQPIRSRLKR